MQRDLSASVAKIQDIYYGENKLSLYELCDLYEDAYILGKTVEIDYHEIPPPLWSFFGDAHPEYDECKSTLAKEQTAQDLSVRVEFEGLIRERLKFRDSLPNQETDALLFEANEDKVCKRSMRYTPVVEGQPPPMYLLPDETVDDSATLDESASIDAANEGFLAGESGSSSENDVPLSKLAAASSRPVSKRRNVLSPVKLGGKRPKSKTPKRNKTATINVIRASLSKDQREPDAFSDISEPAISLGPAPSSSQDAVSDTTAPPSSSAALLEGAAIGSTDSHLDTQTHASSVASCATSSHKRFGFRPTKIPVLTDSEKRKAEKKAKLAAKPHTIMAERVAVAQSQDILAKQTVEQKTSKKKTTKKPETATTQAEDAPKETKAEKEKRLKEEKETEKLYRSDNLRKQIRHVLLEKKLHDRFEERQLQQPVPRRDRLGDRFAHGVVSSSSAIAITQRADSAKVVNSKSADTSFPSHSGTSGDGAQLVHQSSPSGVAAGGDLPTHTPLEPTGHSDLAQQPPTSEHAGDSDLAQQPPPSERAGDSDLAQQPPISTTGFPPQTPTRPTSGGSDQLLSRSIAIASASSDPLVSLLLEEIKDLQNQMKELKENRESPKTLKKKKMTSPATKTSTTTGSPRVSPNKEPRGKPRGVAKSLLAISDSEVAKPIGKQSIHALQVLRVALLDKNYLEAISARATIRSNWHRRPDTLPTRFLQAMVALEDAVYRDDIETETQLIKEMDSIPTDVLRLDDENSEEGCFYPSLVKQQPLIAEQKRQEQDSGKLDETAGPDGRSLSPLAPLSPQAALPEPPSRFLPTLKWNFMPGVEYTLRAGQREKKEVYLKCLEISDMDTVTRDILTGIVENMTPDLPIYSLDTVVQKLLDKRLTLYHEAIRAFTIDHPDEAGRATSEAIRIDSAFGRFIKNTLHQMSVGICTTVTSPSSSQPLSSHTDSPVTSKCSSTPSGRPNKPLPKRPLASPSDHRSSPAPQSSPAQNEPEKIKTLLPSAQKIIPSLDREVMSGFVPHFPFPVLKGEETPLTSDLYYVSKAKVNKNLERHVGGYLLLSNFNLQKSATHVHLLTLDSAVNRTLALTPVKFCDDCENLNPSMPLQDIYLEFPFQFVSKAKCNDILFEGRQAAIKNKAGWMAKAPNPINTICRTLETELQARDWYAGIKERRLSTAVSQEFRAFVTAALMDTPRICAEAWLKGLVTVNDLLVSRQLPGLSWDMIIAMLAHAHASLQARSRIDKRRKTVAETESDKPKPREPEQSPDKKKRRPPPPPGDDDDDDDFIADKDLLI